MLRLSDSELKASILSSLNHPDPATDRYHGAGFGNTTNGSSTDPERQNGHNAALNGSHQFDEASKSEESQEPAIINPVITSDELEAAEEHQGFLPVLKNPNFLALWSGQVFSQLADKVYLVLMIALIASRFQGENQTISGWVSSIMIASTIPAVLFGSVAGVFVDRWFKKAVLVSTNLFRGGLVLTLPLLLWLVHGWSPIAGRLPWGFGILLFITFSVSTLTQFFTPAEQSVIPLVVERKHLLSANSLYTTTMMASVIIGFAVGEPLLAIADHLITRLTGLSIGKELIVGSGYIIAAFLLMLVKTEEKAHPQESEPIYVWQDIQDGLRYLGENKVVRAAIVQLVMLFSVFAALAVLAVRLAELIPGLKASQFGFLLAAGGVGMAGGATLVGHFGRRLGSNMKLSFYGSLGVAGALAGLALAPHQLWLTLTLITLMGIFAALVAVPMQTTVQTETPAAMRGKVFGLQNNAINIALSLPLALAGVAETFFGLRVVLLGLSALAIAGSLTTWYISPKA